LGRDGRPGAHVRDGATATRARAGARGCTQRHRFPTGFGVRRIVSVLRASRSLLYGGGVGVAVIAPVGIPVESETAVEANAVITHSRNGAARNGAGSGRHGGGRTETPGPLLGRRPSRRLRAPRAAQRMLDAC